MLKWYESTKEKIFMESKLRKIHISMLILIMVIFFLVVSNVFTNTSQKGQELYETNLKQAILDNKETYLKDTVNNIIYYIEKSRAEHIAGYQSKMELLVNNISQIEANDVQSYVDTLNLLMHEEKNQEFQVLLTGENETILYTNLINGYNEYFEIKNEYKDAVVKKQYISGEYAIFIWIPEETIYAMVKDEMHEILYKTQYSDKGYIWINEIKNYEGGSQYAIRLIHPNLPETEGEYLSTNTMDVAGNYPYWEELIGIKENGELLYNYYFKEFNSEEISEKMTYAKLYSQYDWVVSMGIYLEDIDSFVTDIDQHNDQLNRELTSTVIKTIILLFFIFGVVIIFIEREFFRKTSHHLMKQSYEDPLTKIPNRRAGKENLSIVLDQHKHRGGTTAVMIIDIDDFKQINDSYGHDKGDEVLIRVTTVINQHIRENDMLSRWGGEEFLLVCSGLKLEDLSSFSEKLLTIVNQEKFYYQDEVFQISFSAGVSFVMKSDETIETIIKRADENLYKAKKNGKNKVIW